MGVYKKFVSFCKNNSSIPVHPITLAFDDALENEFRKVYISKVLRQIRVSLIVGAILYSSFGILDTLLIPQEKAFTLFVRFGIVLPVIVCNFSHSFFKSFNTFFHLHMMALIISAGLGIVAMITVAPSLASYSYYAGLILVFMFGYSFVRMRFIHATISALIIIVSYEIVAVGIVETPTYVVISNNFFFISANVIGMFVSYSIEYYSRRDFYMARELEIEIGEKQELQDELEEVNHISDELYRKYGRARLEEDVFKMYEKLLEKAVNEQKIYRNPDINLRDLAQELSMTTNELSQVINRRSGYTFNSFINFYRVEEVKKELAETGNRDESILQFAYNAGFKSKSTFNASFKKFTGMTPKAYREEFSDE